MVWQKYFPSAFQTMRHSSRPGQIYLIDVDAINTGIPYADSFYVTQHWCLSRIAPGDPEFVQGAKDSSRIALISNIVYKKTVWGIVKSKSISNLIEPFDTDQIIGLGQDLTCEYLDF